MAALIAAAPIASKALHNAGMTHAPIRESALSIQDMFGTAAILYEYDGLGRFAMS